MAGLNDGLNWPKVLHTIRGMNRNMAPGKDEIHINVLKAMVREESMAQLRVGNPDYVRLDFVNVDLLLDQLPLQPLTKLGKVFHALLERTWQTGCIPDK
jgi:hypothetical protein